MNISSEYYMSLCNYVLALSTGINLENHRDNIKLDVGSDAKRFRSVLDNLIMKAMHRVSKDQIDVSIAQDEIENEYNKLGFDLTFLNYSYLRSIVDILLTRNEYISEDEVSKKAFCQTLYDHSKLITMENLKYGMYSIILKSIVHNQLVTDMQDVVGDITMSLSSVSSDDLLMLSAFDKNF